MDTETNFEVFENAMADALNSGVISIENAYINDDGKTNLNVTINHPCPKLISEIYQNKSQAFKTRKVGFSRNIF